MTSPTPIAVTGATGAVGARVAQQLHDAGVPLRLVVRDASRAPRWEGGAAVEVVEASYGDSAAVRRALEGIELAFMVSAAESADRVAEHAAFIESARASGVGHLVYTSFFGAAPDAVFTLGRDHYATEQLLRASGLGFTALRDNFYADFLPMLAGEDGVIRGPARDGRVAAVARADVADAAVAVLRELHAAAAGASGGGAGAGTISPHVGAVYELTGPEALTLAEVAGIVSELGGRGPVVFHDETIDEAYASRASYGAPPWQLDAWVSTYTAIATGELARVTPDVERLTGHPPRSLRDLLAAAAGPAR
ncbi:SDR family oxidoreductase [Herbiconiux sp. CPCC 205716]|uniref:SDR family oxidoreductase n=1 Tax=Herbiconiux gentiana TaxID=2970912 RepID=A0ABT2GHR7_9MICO|nr:SDR family oxidoreductase [Herbiconiux gentiana]MCS5715766.1 SDR family oxidoreductase [Herbiconiux gentiana]